MDYKYIFLLDDNETTNFYNTDVVADYAGNAEVQAYTDSDSFIKFFSGNPSLLKIKSLLLLDINMPVKSGFEVLEELEENSVDINELDVIMLSSSNLKVDYEKATRFINIIGYIEKPLTLEKLNKILIGDF